MLSLLRLGTDERMWEQAVAAEPDLVTITSWNEWGEGTQIEPAQAFATDGRTYLDYGNDPEHYVKATRRWSAAFQSRNFLTATPIDNNNADQGEL